jgi:hypothetical protein
VGRVLWRKTIPLTSQVKGRWTRYNLDVTELTAKHPGALFQLSLSISPKDAQWECPGASENQELDDPEPVNQETGDDGYAYSNWDFYDDYYYEGGLTGTNATIRASRPTTATRAWCAPRATCWPRTSA